MLANLQSVLNVKEELTVSKLETPVMIRKNALLILAITQLENAPTSTKFLKNAQLEDNVKRILTAKNGSLNKNLMEPASPLFVMHNSELAKLFLTVRDAHQESAKQVVQQEQNVKKLSALMMSTPNSSVNIKEKSATIATNVLLILAMTLKVASLLMIRPSLDVKTQSAKRKLIALLGLSNKNLKITAKKLSAMSPPILANLSC